MQRAEVRGKTELLDLEQSASHPQALPRLLDEPDERRNQLHSEALSGHQHQSVAIISRQERSGHTWHPDRRLDE